MKGATMTTLEQVKTKADQLYRRQVSTQEWLDTFTPLQLAKLWHTSCVYRQDQDQLISPEAYDDEVYDALNILGYWDI